MSIPTVKIVNPASDCGWSLINESDFDPAEHKLAKGETAPAEPITRDAIATMKKGDLAELLEAHGVTEPPKGVAAMRDLLTSIMFVGD